MINAIQNPFIINKHWLSIILLRIGMIIAFFGSLNPWFMWCIGPYYIYLSSLIILLSMLTSANSKNNIYTRKNFLFPIMAYFILVYYQVIVNDESFGLSILKLFQAIIFLAIFRIDLSILYNIPTIICKIMACIMCLSIPAFFMYLIGFPLPSINANYGELYEYSNYFFFLLDDRFMTTIIPRFNSVFLEPGQMGSATALLLSTQCGKWHKWYNIILILTTLISFSLAAYVMLFIITFLNIWIQKKNIFRKLIGSITIASTIIIGSFFYNEGYNLVHDLIVMRLEVEDGEMAGDNRVDNNFQADYDNFIQSSDIIFGRDLDREWGSAGYKIFYYDFGLIGLILLAIFYSSSLMYATNKRTMTSALILSTLNFIVRDFPLWFGFYIPIYCTAYTIKIESEVDNHEENSDVEISTI